jgi:hypothetical protein
MKGKFEPMHSIQITEEGVTKLLKKFNPHKTPGPDNITPENAIWNCLFRMLALSLESGNIIPSALSGGMGYYLTFYA